MRTRISGFLLGLLLGVVGTISASIFLAYHGQEAIFSDYQFPNANMTLQWLTENLGWSLPVFGLLLCLYIFSLNRLRRQLAMGAPVETIAQSDHLVDTWISLFFGVGVIWTAIGMRGALVYALGDAETTLGLGAYAILERMVQGGILVALSTTIVGGIGGYLLRVIKTLSVESDIKRFYDESANAPGIMVQATLSKIESHLKALSQRTTNQT